MTKGNDQLIRTVPGTDVGGKDTAGVDGKPRTERAGELLGTPDPDSDTAKHTAEARDLETERGDYVREEVDRANREELPKLGGNIEDTWTKGETKARASRGSAKPAATPAPAPIIATPAVAPAPKADEPK